ncbi:MAG TPA: O-methyltransferase [Cryomorphaceae bacterium]|nr:O-methyltransferase [Cryomorphaceae bacterium]
MEFIDPALERYVHNHSQKESELLNDLNRETYLKVLQPRMLSGHIQGRILSMYSKLIQPKCILEIGTYTGYSAICLAEGLATGGVLHTIEKNEELKPIANRYFEKAGLKDRIQLHNGDALPIIQSMEETFDLVFIDADKTNYINYYEAVLPKMKSGGCIIADNVLWSGKVLDEEELDKDPDTSVLNEFNKMVSNDERVDNVLLPVRDGLMVIRKK